MSINCKSENCCYVRDGTSGYCLRHQCPLCKSEKSENSRIGERKLYFNGTEKARSSSFYDACETVLGLKKGTFKLLDDNDKLVSPHETIGTRTRMYLVV